MCLDCGCDMPNNDHGDHRHILLPDLAQAAQASGITIQEAAANIPHTLRDSLGDPSSVFARFATLPTLVFDVDDTMSFTTDAFLIALNASFDTAYTAGNVNTFNWRLELPADQRAWLAAQASQSDIYENVSPNWHAMDTLHYAQAHGYPVQVATERDRALYDTTAHWLDRWGVQVEGLAVLGFGGKRAWLRENFDAANPVVLIDDSPRQWALYGPGVDVWTPRHHWTPHSAPPGVWVFDDWEQTRAALAASL